MDSAPRLWILDDQGLGPGVPVPKEGFQAAAASGHHQGAIDYVGVGDGDDYGDGDGGCVEQFHA